MGRLLVPEAKYLISYLFRNAEPHKPESVCNLAQSRMTLIIQQV